MNAAIEAMTALCETRTTEELFDMLHILEAEKTILPSGLRNHADPAKRMTEAAIADTIEERHNLTEHMERIFMDMEYAGTYTDALTEALAESKKEPRTMNDIERLTKAALNYVPDADIPAVTLAMLGSIGVQPARPYSGPSKPGDDAFTRRDPTALEYAAMWLQRHLDGLGTGSRNDMKTWDLARKLYNQKRTLFDEIWDGLPQTTLTVWFDIARLAEETIEENNQ